MAFINMLDKRRYTNYPGNITPTETVAPKAIVDDDIVNRTIRDVLGNIDNVRHLYDVVDFYITEQTFIDDPLIANVLKTSSFPDKLVLTIYDANGTVQRHYVAKGSKVHLVSQKDSFHMRMILLVNQSLQKRGLDSRYVINDLTGSNLNEINLTMVNFLDQL